MADRDTARRRTAAGTTRTGAAGPRGLTADATRPGTPPLCPDADPARRTDAGAAQAQTRPGLRTRTGSAGGGGALLLTAAVMAAAAGCGSDALSEAVTLLRLPEGGRLPQMVIDDDGVVQAVYVTGEPRGGDLLHVARAPDAAAWSTPRRVNARPGTVVGIGPIDGGQIALGRDGRLHVVWFKLGRTEFLYTRTAEGGGRFEPPLALASGEGVEAGPAVAADREGGVYVTWHTGPPPDAERAVYLAASHDDGRTFTPARPISAPAEGACDCCGLDALAAADGTVYVSYRGAGGNIRRGQRLLTSHDRGATFADALIDPWELNACPISTTRLAAGPDSAAVAWETAGQVAFSRVDALGQAAAAPAGDAAARRKHPAVAVNHRGETLLAWADGFGWQAGGTFHWQLFDAAGRPTADRGAGPAIPDGSLPAVAAAPDGRFLVVF